MIGNSKIGYAPRIDHCGSKQMAGQNPERAGKDSMLKTTDHMLAVHGTVAVSKYIPCPFSFSIGC